ncbi:endopeptidase La [bacterium]|nr:endopeptidase La [bacterium]
MTDIPSINDEPLESIEIPSEAPVIPLRDLVVFPYLVVPISVGREASVKALEEALETDRKLILVTQRDIATEIPSPEDVFKTGTLSIILRMARMENEVRILAQGLSRVNLTNFVQTEPYLKARIKELKEPKRTGITVDALIKTIREQFKKLAYMGKNIPQDVLSNAERIEHPGMLADMVTTNLDLPIEKKQNILELIDPEKRLKKVVNHLIKEVEIISVSTKIQDVAQSELGKAHREYILREQLKAIQKELGEGDERQQEIIELREKIKESGMPDDVKEKAEKEVTRLERMHPDAAEASVVRTYLDWLIALPWDTSTKDNLNIMHVQKILDEDHYGLDDVKERLLEYLSVKKIKPDMKGPILCFVGPPGVGKTSLGRSIARAMGRSFHRISLGGIRDEAEIRGHRRTYVGALPGRIIQGIRLAKSNNPVFMLDEIDKVGADFRGDPSSALLEVLDPEQNFSFSDHYLDVQFNLSKVMFIATANLIDPIIPALRDRMEIIELTSYTVREKIEIARRHLLPKQILEHGLKKKQIQVNKQSIERIISQYTRESGVRNLERELARLCRKIARDVASGKRGPFKITKDSIPKYLGTERYTMRESMSRDTVGVATGLVWTQVGGEIILVEASRMPGKGELKLTGHLGQVMQESIQAAMSWVRSNCKTLGINGEDFEKYDVHVHVPSGAIPKDGPSAGIVMATVIASLFTGKPVSKDVAITGEITLQGRVLPVGGLKEKLLAANRAGMKTVILPYENERWLDKIPDEVKKKTKFILVKHVSEVIDKVLVKSKSEIAAGKKKGTSSKRKKTTKVPLKKKIDTIDQPRAHA